MEETKTVEQKTDALSRLEPNPQAKTEGGTEARPAKQAEPVVATTIENPAIKAKSGLRKAVSPKKQPVESQRLDLGAGYSIEHRAGSGYSIFYQVVAKHGNFAEVAADLKGEKYDVSKKSDADELISKMIVPVEKLEGWCRATPGWDAHAEKKTTILKDRIKDGDKDAKGILENKSRGDGRSWTGNILEYISTCVGYYNYLMKKRSGKKVKVNKNVKKFEEAGVVFRRFNCEKKRYVMMFPQQFVDIVKTAILTSRGINEDV